MAEENKTTAEETAEEVKETEAAEEGRKSPKQLLKLRQEAKKWKRPKRKLFGKKEKDKKDEKIEELTDRVKRQMAEFENFRKRTEKEKAGMYAVGAKDVIEKILPVVEIILKEVWMSVKTKILSYRNGKIYKQFLTALDGMR